MYLYTCGTVYFMDPVPNQMRGELMNIFSCQSDTVYFTDNRLDIEMAYGDLDDTLNEVTGIANQYGVGIDPEKTVLRYGGDYDGGYLFTDGEFYSCDIEEYIIRTADTESLLNELSRRGVRTG